MRDGILKISFLAGIWNGTNSRMTNISREKNCGGSSSNSCSSIDVANSNNKDFETVIHNLSHGIYVSLEENLYRCLSWLYKIHFVIYTYMYVLYMSYIYIYIYIYICCIYLWVSYIWGTLKKNNKILQYYNSHFTFFLQNNLFSLKLLFAFEKQPLVFFQHRNLKTKFLTIYSLFITSFLLENLVSHRNSVRGPNKWKSEVGGSRSGL